MLTAESAGATGPQQNHAALIARWADHPAAMVRELFGAEPDPWQEEALEAFPKGQRLAMAACKGPGKTTVLAWLIWNFLLTRPQPKIAATSVSEDNINDNLWPELAKWQQKAPLLQDSFVWTKTRIFAKASPETWFCSLRTWSKSADPQQQSQTLAGFHADYVMFVLDESGGIPDAVMASAEAALASGKECHLLQAGNPTHLTGPLYRASTSERHLWYLINITGDPDDTKRSSRVSAQWAREQIAKYGRDNPWVLVNVFGKFPPSSINVLIGPEEIAAAVARIYRPADIMGRPKVMGVDVARFGDDASVLWPRQGMQAFLPFQWRNLDSVQGAAVVAGLWKDWQPDAVFVDDTGGFGAGWIDQLKVLQYDPIGVPFNGQAIDAERYANKRAEMYFTAAQWIRDGGSLPNVPELVQGLTQTTYTFERAGRGRMIIEAKDQIKARLGFSPDHADSFALTFAAPVQPKAPMGRGRRMQHQIDYNPYAAAYDREQTEVAHSANPWSSPRDRIEHYNPYAGAQGG